MKTLLTTCTLVLGLGFASSAYAHHSMNGFDRAKTITITGTIKQFKWANPHSWIEVEVVNRFDNFLASEKTASQRKMFGELPRTDEWLRRTSPVPALFDIVHAPDLTLSSASKQRDVSRQLLRNVLAVVQDDRSKSLSQVT